MYFRTPLHFSTAWKTYHMSEMDLFETGTPLEPVIYVSQDRKCVFVQGGTGETAPEANRAGPAEITQLWQRHRLVALLAVMKVSN